MYKEEFEVIYLERDSTSRYKELYGKKKFSLKTLNGVLSRIKKEDLKVLSIVHLKRDMYESRDVEEIKRYNVKELVGKEVEYGIDHASGKFIVK